MTVQLSALSINYGKLVAVDEVSVEFPPGAVGLLGRNGAGKTSILRALLGLVRPSHGQMRILDLPAEASPLEIRRQVGYMPEKETHIPRLNGYETVRIAARLTGLPALEAARRAHEVLYLVDLEEQRYRPVSGYSAGMKQKVKLAVALVHDPKVLFLDEPTNGLDPAGRQEMLRLIRQLAQELGKSIILSSHILQDVENVCENVILLERGKVLAAGPVGELTRSESRSLHLVAEGEAEILERELLAAGMTRVTAQAEEEGGYLVDLPEGKEIQALFQAVLRAGGRVRCLQQRRRSLEDVFVGAVRSSQNDGNDGNEGGGEGVA